MARLCLPSNQQALRWNSLRDSNQEWSAVMRIAQVAPLYESVPPKLYGGTERVVSWLTEELVRLGHEVTLFASGDSMTTARLSPSAKMPCVWTLSAPTSWRITC